jgi:hypothetical protein
MKQQLIYTEPLKIYPLLNTTEIHCLLELIDSRQREGDYFGNKEHYYKRLETIKKKLTLTSEGKEDK